jgi:uncharacterized protein (DUF779 family)
MENTGWEGGPMWYPLDEWLESARDMTLSINGGPMWFSKMIEWLA